jgi:uncharacterized protein (DUF1697 family)
MRYIALLRGINVGGAHKVEMKKLRELFLSLGYTDVSTYINSGNVFFEATGKVPLLRKKISDAIESTFGFPVPTLVKSRRDMQNIANAVPQMWGNDADQKTDVAYLFPEIDTPKTIDDLPLNRDIVAVRYVPGALFWNVVRKSLGKSRLNKVAAHPLYRLMTVRNVNTCRYLGGYGG